MSPKLPPGAAASLRELRRLAKLLSHPVRADDVRVGHKPLYLLLLQQFGSFPRARDAAGLPPPASRRRWSQARVIAEIRTLHEAGRPVTVRVISRHGPVGLKMAVMIYAGGLRRARRLARIPEPRRRHRSRFNWDPGIVIRAIERRHRAGDSIAFSRTPRALTATACKLFGTWQAAVEAAGIDYGSVRMRPRYSDDELFDRLRAFAKAQPAASITEVREQPWGLSIVRRFGSVQAAARAAKLTRWPVRRLAVPYDRKDTERRLRARHARGKPMFRSAVERDDLRLSVAVDRHFGTWATMLTALRLPNDSPRKTLMLRTRS